MWYDTLYHYAEQNLWVPVVGGVAIVLVVLLILWQCQCCCFARTKLTKYAKLLDDGRSVEAGVAVNYGSSSSDVLAVNMPKGRAGDDSERQAMAMRAQYFLRANRQFKLLQHLPTIGTKVDKAWFVVKPPTQIDQVMAMYPATERTLLPVNPKMRQAMRDVLLLLQHPYILPVFHFDMLAEQNQIVVMSNLSVKGSARDLLHGSNPIIDIERKYRLKAKVMPLKRIALLGRHVLEALAFLKKRKFAYRHLHAGNVILSDGVFKISGLEQSYFGHTHKDDKFISKGLDKAGGDVDSPWEYDVICFGRMLFELGCGYELRSSVPDVEQLVGKCEYQVIEILVLVFFHPDNRIPTVEELIEQPLFQSANCSELDRYLPAPMVLTDEVKAILKCGRKLKSLVRKTVKKSSASGRSKRRYSSSSSYHNPEFSGAESAVQSPAQSPAVSPPTSRANSSVPPPPPPAAPATAAPPPPPPTTTAPPNPPAVAPPTPPADDSGRGSLLASIRQGTGLRKTETRDKSGPML